ncbi:phospholipase B1, membrane-associated-like [Physella acuta]|uniref:phospholipase B1, membrane-associated-like n=1 Tax=Physella acuta TaxID=109671 RepID=UPI0027DDBE86|nr:phospholipase B1, membrane-associated-like [Physella acuta]
MSYFSSDCFHYSKKGHITVAKSLWRNMLEPIQDKSTSIDWFQDTACPREDHPYLYTRKNSQKQTQSHVMQLEEKEVSLVWLPVLVMSALGAVGLGCLLYVKRRRDQARYLELK